MTFLVPFDGSELAEAALARAVEFGAVLEETILAVVIVPRDNEEYAEEQGWLEPGESFEVNTVVSGLHEQVTALAPGANFKHELVGRNAQPGTISTCLRRVAREADASMVFVGSENAGHIVTSISSVGSAVAADDAYDVVVVRNRRPARAAKVRNASPKRRETSELNRPE